MKILKHAQPSIFFIIGGVIFIGAIIFRFGPLAVAKDQNYWVKTSLTERDVAIRLAKEAGQTTYSFETNFIPGLGKIDNPEKYKAELKKSLDQKSP